MKIVTLLCISFFIGNIYAQNQEIDSRLTKYHADQMVTLYENNKDYYDFLVYELDNGYYTMDNIDNLDAIFDVNIRTINTVSERDGSAFQADYLNDPSFNFFNFNFIRLEDKRTIYDLGNGKYLTFYSLTEVKDNFGQ